MTTSERSTPDAFADAFRDGGLATHALASAARIQQGRMSPQ
jgi:hypothetical protein